MYPGAFEAERPERFDPWLAMHFLTYRERRRQRRRPPSRVRETGIDEARDEILHRLRALKRQRGRR